MNNTEVAHDFRNLPDEWFDQSTWSAKCRPLSCTHAAITHTQQIEWIPTGQLSRYEHHHCSRSHSVMTSWFDICQRCSSQTFDSEADSKCGKICHHHLLLRILTLYCEMLRSIWSVPPIPALYLVTASGMGTVMWLFVAGEYLRAECTGSTS